MKAENLLGRSKEEIKEALIAFGIAEGALPKNPECYNFAREIIEVCADKAGAKSQTTWIDYFNSKKQAMASMADLYHLFKIEDKQLLAKFKASIKDKWIVTSTRLIYPQERLEAKVVHHFESNIVKPVEKDFTIQEYSEIPLYEALQDPLALDFFRYLFGTTDDEDEMIETLSEGVIGANNIKILTTGLGLLTGKYELAKAAMYSSTSNTVTISCRAQAGDSFARACIVKP